MQRFRTITITFFEYNYFLVNHLSPRILFTLLKNFGLLCYSREGSQIKTTYYKECRRRVLWEQGAVKNIWT